MAQERAGDWACQRCGNHNFAFRHSCNKCQLTLQENDELLVQNETMPPAPALLGAAQPYGQPATQPPVHPAQMLVNQLLPQTQPGMGENVIHIHQYNTNCSFNSYQMPSQPMMAQANINLGGQRVTGPQPMPSAQPFYPCYQAQQQLPQWTPAAP